MQGMRIQVDCRDGDDPRAFYLAARRLHIARVLERRTEDSARRFRVRVEDGRIFELIREAAGEWRLASVGGFRQAKAAPSSSDFGAR
jgi:hypothetical protein